MSRELKLAADAAKGAGEILKRIYVQGSEICSATGKDIKLAADVEAERYILNVLRSGSTYPILSEEEGPDSSLDCRGPHWIVDPLDGTFNFSRRLKFCCVSIGFWEHDRPICGLVYDFMQGARYEGIVGEGASRVSENSEHRTPISVSDVRDFSSAAICTGFPSGRNYARDSLLAFVDCVQRFKKIRLIGSAALSLAWVASGSVEAYHEEDIFFWDVAAGLALVQAAGGSFDVRPGSSRWQVNVAASNGLIALSV